MAQSWAPAPGCPKALLCAAGPASSLNIWPDVASVTPWPPDLFTAEAETSPKKAQARLALTAHVPFGPRVRGEQVCCTLGASPSLHRTQTFALRERTAHVSFWKRQTCCTSSMGVIREIPGRGTLTFTNKLLAVLGWDLSLGQNSSWGLIFSGTDNGETALTLGNRGFVILLLLDPSMPNAEGKMETYLSSDVFHLPCHFTKPEDRIL